MTQATQQNASEAPKPLGEALVQGTTDCEMYRTEGLHFQPEDKFSSAPWTFGLFGQVTIHSAGGGGGVGQGCRLCTTAGLLQTCWWVPTHRLSSALGQRAHVSNAGMFRSGHATTF